MMAWYHSGLALQAGPAAKTAASGDSQVTGPVPRCKLPELAAPVGQRLLPAGGWLRLGFVK